MKFRRFLEGASYLLLGVSLIYFLIQQEYFGALKLGLGILILAIPRILKPFWNRNFSNISTCGYYGFIVLSIWGGEFIGLYGLFDWFDSFLHVGSGALIALMSYELLSQPEIKIPVWLKYLIIFSIVMAIGSLWEIYEFTFDSLLGFNMQRYKDLHTDTAFVGQAALYDTMKDIICNAGGALLAMFLLAATSQTKPVKQPYNK